MKIVSRAFIARPKRFYKVYNSVRSFPDSRNGLKNRIIVEECVNVRRPIKMIFFQIIAECYLL